MHLIHREKEKSKFSQNFRWNVRQELVFTLLKGKRKDNETIIPRNVKASDVQWARIGETLKLVT